MFRVAAAVGAAWCLSPSSAGNPDAAALVQSAVRVHRDVADGIANGGSVLETGLQSRGTHDEIEGILAFEGGDCHGEAQCTLVWGERMTLGSFYLKVNKGLQLEDKLGFHGVFVPDPLDEGSPHAKFFPRGIAPITVDAICEFCKGECRMEIASETFGRVNATRPTTAKGPDICWDERLKVGINRVVALPNWGFTLPGCLGPTIEAIKGGMEMEVSVIHKSGQRIAVNHFPKKRFGPRGSLVKPTVEPKPERRKDIPAKWLMRSTDGEEAEGEHAVQLDTQVEKLREPGGVFALAQGFFQKVAHVADLETFLDPSMEADGNARFTTGADVAVNEIEERFVKPHPQTNREWKRGIIPTGAHYSLQVNSSRCLNTHKESKEKDSSTSLMKGSFKCGYELGAATPASMEVHVVANLEPGARITVTLEEPVASGLLGITLKRWFSRMPTKQWSFPVCGPETTLKMGGNKMLTLPEMPCGHYTLDMAVAHDVFMLAHADWTKVVFPGNIQLPLKATYRQWQARARVQFEYQNSTVYDATYYAGFECDKKKHQEPPPMEAPMM